MKHKTILFFVSLDRRCFDKQLDGIFRCPSAGNWHVQVVSDAFSATEVRKSLEFWKPSGVIVECGDALKVSPSLFNGIPTVFIDIGRRSPPKGFNVVGFDSSAAGRMGAEHLLGLDLPTYAYVGFHKPVLWDRERRAAFAETVRKAGRHVETFSPARPLSPAERRDRLLAWINGLPRPCGLMACNDCVGEEVLNICSRLGIRVPDDIAVLGVDNDETLCENTSPPLASIDAGTSRGGMMVARILDDLMANASGGEGASVLAKYLPLRVVVRQSVRRLVCDRSKVALALEMIRRRACEGIGVDDVVAGMGVSRRAAEKHFRLATGKSMLDEIDDVRFAKVFEMLRNPGQQIGAIAGVCGFSTEVALRKAFRLRTGMSMTAWRNTNAIG
jgi:LacI family transcriptional regulator